MLSPILTILLKTLKALSMNKQRRIPKGKFVRPTFFVFCEGETEEAYIAFLRSTYKLPIEIDAKIAGNRITAKYIDNYRKTKDFHPKDKTYLVYDLDVAEILPSLQKIKDTILIASNPCFELWYLLHYQNQQAELSSKECENSLSIHVKNYKKGYIHDKLKLQLSNKKEEAVERAKRLKTYSNPSTDVFKIIEDLERIKY